MTKMATPTNGLLPHPSSAGTVVKCSAPSPPYTPAESVQPAVTSSVGSASVAPAVPGSPCTYTVEQCHNGHSIILNNNYYVATNEEVKQLIPQFIALNGIKHVHITVPNSGPQLWLVRSHTWKTVEG